MLLVGLPTIPEAYLKDIPSLVLDGTNQRLLSAIISTFTIGGLADMMSEQRCDNALSRTPVHGAADVFRCVSVGHAREQGPCSLACLPIMSTSPS